MKEVTEQLYGYLGEEHFRQNNKFLGPKGGCDLCV